MEDMEQELTPVEATLAKLSRVSSLLQECSTSLCIEEARQRVAGQNKLRGLTSSLDGIGDAVAKLAAFLAQSTGAAPATQLNNVARDVESALINLGSSARAARIAVLAAIQEVGSDDFTVLFNRAVQSGPSNGGFRGTGK